MTYKDLVGERAADSLFAAQLAKLRAKLAGIRETAPNVVHPRMQYTVALQQDSRRPLPMSQQVQLMQQQQQHSHLPMTARGSMPGSSSPQSPHFDTQQPSHSLRSGTREDMSSGGSISVCLTATAGEPTATAATPASAGQGLDLNPIRSEPGQAGGSASRGISYPHLLVEPGSRHGSLHAVSEVARPRLAIVDRVPAAWGDQACLGDSSMFGQQHQERLCSDHRVAQHGSYAYTTLGATLDLLKGRSGTPAWVGVVGK